MEVALNLETSFSEVSIKENVFWIIRAYCGIDQILISAGKPSFEETSTNSSPGGEISNGSGNGTKLSYPTEKQQVV